MDGDLYSNWLPNHLYYLVHLVGWMGPVLLLQWLVGWKILKANKRSILWPVFIIGTYLIATDVVAVSLGIWFFDPELILSGAVDQESSPFLFFLFQPFGVPLEEWLFFYLTAALCAQSFILFLPERFRQGI